ncbi:MAG: hypothetical protein QW369_00210 [Desulfurococcaceae archaeon]
MIYLCKFNEHDQVIPRHHIAGISLCKIYAGTDLSYIESVVSKDIIEKLIKHRDLMIVDGETIAKILRDIPEECSYLRLVLLDERL